jgi:hypothetical protein
MEFKSEYKHTARRVVVVSLIHVDCFAFALCFAVALDVV